MMKSLKVSFIIAAYNEELFITECVESCLNQSYPNIEVCITDDGSTDNTWNILEGLALDPRVKISKFDSNKGKVAAFNRSFSLATGEFIAIIGADDVNFLDRVETELEFLHQSQSDLVWGGFEVVDEALNHISTYEPNSLETVTTKMILEKNVVTGGTILMSQKIASNIFPLPISLKFEDWWIGYMASSLGKISYLKHVLIKYRQHANNAAGGSDKNTVLQLQDNFKRHFSFYEAVQNDLVTRYNEPECSEFRRIVDGSIVYRKICVENVFVKRLKLLIQERDNVLSLRIPSIIKLVLISIIGLQTFVTFKKIVRK